MPPPHVPYPCRINLHIPDLTQNFVTHWKFSLCFAIRPTLNQKLIISHSAIQSFSHQSFRLSDSIGKRNTIFKPERRNMVFRQERRNTGFRPKLPSFLRIRQQEKKSELVLENWTVLLSFKHLGQLLYLHLYQLLYCMSKK